MEKRKDGKRTKGLVIGGICGVVLIGLLVALLCAMGGKLVVGKNIAFADITEFYYTRSSSTNPPDYQRYHFLVQDGAGTFYHEKREGNHWPLTEEDVTLSGTVELSQQELETFFTLLKDGQVVKREEAQATGGSGPWLYLYWTGDRGKYQAFSFSSWQAQRDFEAFCIRLQGKE